MIDAAELDRDRIAWVLLDALALGDRAAALKWRLSRRTVERYRAQLRVDEELARVVAEKRRGAELELGALRVRFLRNAIGQLEKRLRRRTVTVREIAGAIKIVGELHQVAEVLGEQSDSAGPDAEEAPADSSVGHSEAH
jgi:hypothetical protein